MKLEEISLSNVGPFSNKKISFEPDVTVLTGANDTGKSTLLRILRAICARSADDVIEERDVNFDHLSHAARPWREDSSIRATARFTENTQVNVCLAPGCWKESEIKRPGAFHEKIIHRNQELPRVIILRDRDDEGVRQKLIVTDPNPTERRFLNVAFGPQMNTQALASHSEDVFLHTVARAEETLNQRLNAFLPPTLPYRFRFNAFSDKRNELFVSLIDAHGGTTALGQRGSGVQKMINLLGALATENLNSNTLLLIDEPETHLHADAQHSLRAALEQLGRLDTVQVIYATHSPSMINPLRPECIRLLKRSRNKNLVITEVENSPFAGGFSGVRTSLGIGPADSLLYAPLVVMVEGKTEALCVPLLIARVPGFGEDFKATLAQTVFVDAEACGNVEMLCRLAKANGARVVVYADGDTGVRWHNALAKAHSDIPIITLPKNEEFEQVVPAIAYFEALAEQISKPSEEINEAALVEWEKQNAPPEHLRFTKRIDKWLTHAKDSLGITKAPVMRGAIERAEANSIKWDSLQALAEAMQKALQKPPVIPAVSNTNS